MPHYSPLSNIENIHHLNTRKLYTLQMADTSLQAPLDKCNYYQTIGNKREYNVTKSKRKLSLTSYILPIESTE